MKWVALLMIFMLGNIGFRDSRAESLDQEAPEAKGGANESARFADERAIFDYLKPILKFTNKTARIYYVGSCEKEGDYYVVSFPSVRVQSPLVSDAGLAAIKDIFRSDANVKVSESTNGIFRIVIGRLPTYSTVALNTKISVVTFDQDQQYTEKLALTRIQSSKEIKEARQALDTQPDGIPLYMGGVKRPNVGAPHLPASMVNLTWDDALDSVAKTFGGVVLYGTCSTRRFYSIHYVPLKS